MRLPTCPPMRAAVLLLAVLSGPGAHAVPAAGASGYGNCPDGHICFYEETDGRGEACRYDRTDADAIASCPFERDGGKVVKSVANRSTFRVHYFLDPHCRTRIGSTLSGGQGNLSGRYQVASLNFGSDAAC